MPKSSAKKTRTAKARVLSSREVYHGPAFRVTADEVLEPSGVRTRRDIVHHSGSVVILAIEEGKSEPRVLLERQYRHAARQMLWELPAGRIDEGENDLHAAKRELLEETGYTASLWRRILSFYASPGFLAEAMNVYFARGLRPGPAQPEADEVIYVRMVPLSAAVRMVMRGTIKDGKTIAGVLWLSQSREGSKPRK
jgi:ADP-ribose pyrophosphatase